MPLYHFSIVKFPKADKPSSGKEERRRKNGRNARAASLGDLYAPKRIFSCNTASKCHSRRQPCCGILSCLAEKSPALECFAVLKVRFFSYRKTQRTKKYWMYFKDDRLSVRKKILSKPCKSLSESAQSLPPFFILHFSLYWRFGFSVHSGQPVIAL